MLAHVSLPWRWNDLSSPLYRKGSGVLEKVKAILWLSRAEARLRAFYCGVYLVPVCAAGTVDGKSSDSRMAPRLAAVGARRAGPTEGRLLPACSQAFWCVLFSVGVTVLPVDVSITARLPHEHHPPPGDSQGSDGGGEGTCHLTTES